VVAAVVTAFYGRLYDKKGFQGSAIPMAGMLLTGYVILYFTRMMAPVFIGSLLMMTGYMTGMAVFGAMIRDLIPAGRAGQFQGIRIIGQVLIPGIIGPAIGAWVLRDAQLIVPVMDYSFPTKDCCDTPGCCAEDPCEMFSRIPFPTQQFAPRGCDGQNDGNCQNT
jgi:hypothetical protein